MIGRKRVLLLGATGMVGSAVYGVLKDGYDLVLAVRNVSKVGLLEKAYGGTESHQIVSFEAGEAYKDFLNKKGYPGAYLTSFLNTVGEVDAVINAAGIIIPFALDNPDLTFFLNSSLPHLLANIFGSKMIHATTDCVFNGQEGFPYDENSPKTPMDLYGLTKSLGEPPKCLVIRTSMIGRELNNFVGLLEWLLHQGGEVKGFADHYWNGITTKQFGKICDRIISDRESYPSSGTYHVFSTILSKYEMLNKLKAKFNLDMDIEENHETRVNRTLSSIYNLNKELNVPTFDEMLAEL